MLEKDIENLLAKYPLLKKRFLMVTSRRSSTCHSFAESTFFMPSILIAINSPGVF